MAVIGSRKRTKAADLWWRAQLRHWTMPAAEAYVRAHPIRPAAPAPLDRQEPTETVTMRARDAATGKQVEVGVAQRRKSEHALWASFSPEDEWCATRIAAAFACIERGMGIKNTSAEHGRGDGGAYRGVTFTALVDDYFAWGRECTRHRVDHSAIMDVLGYGKSCREADRGRGKRKGYVRQQLAEGLELYYALHGHRMREAAA